MAQKQWANSCCNSFNNQRHKKTSLRPWMGAKILTLTLEEKICSNCTKNCQKMEITQYESSDDDFQHQDLESVNKGLALIGESPVVKNKLLPGAQYPKRKLDKIKSDFHESILGGKVKMTMTNVKLKMKFHETEEKSIKVQILTLLPMSWSIKRIENDPITWFVKQKA